MGPDDEFTGAKLLRLVLDIEMQISRHAAGATPLGRAVTDLCEDAISRDRNKPLGADDAEQGMSP